MGQMKHACQKSLRMWRNERKIRASIAHGWTSEGIIRARDCGYRGAIDTTRPWKKEVIVLGGPDWRELLKFRFEKRWLYLAWASSYHSDTLPSAQSSIFLIVSHWTSLSDNPGILAFCLTTVSGHKLDHLAINSTTAVAGKAGFTLAS